MKSVLSCALLLAWGSSIASYAAPIPPRAFLEYRLRSLRGNALSVTLTASIPGDVCNDYDIGGEFLRVNESSELPEYPTFVGDVIIESTNIPCPASPPVVTNIHRVFTFEPTAGEDEHLILLIPSEFSVRVRDAFSLDVVENTKGKNSI